MLAVSLSEAGMLWIDRTSNPGSWDYNSPPPVDSQTALELLLAYHGWGRAGRYLQEMLGDDEKMSIAVRAYYRRIEMGQMACLIGDRLPRNLAVVASAYDFIVVSRQIDQLLIGLGNAKAICVVANTEWYTR